MQISRIRLSDKTVTPLLSRATPSAVSEHSAEFIGCPISRSFTTYCICLELRSLPSTGVTRLQRYYEPLRHPIAPGLSLAGVRLIIANHALWLPVFRALSLCTCRRHYPGAASGRIASLTSSRRISLPRKGWENAASSRRTPISDMENKFSNRDWVATSRRRRLSQTPAVRITLAIIYRGS